eukprot:GHVS01069151.1.p1 GENE.GHVS01069151.1~~GHVS01069151.1.p1  ORF type:complete len:441 (-),score=65.48 GHVS01069151.1:326-1648(-)
MEAVICFGGVCVVWSLYYAWQHWMYSEVVGVGKMTDLANTMKGFVCSFPMRGGAFCACLLPPARPSAVQQSAFQERWGLPLLLLLRHVVCGGYYCLSICRQELASIYDYYYYHHCVKNRSSRYGNAASKVGMVFFFTTILLTPSEVLSHIVASSSPQHTASSTYADLTTNDVSGVAPTTWAGTTTASEIHALSGSQHAPTTLSRRRWLKKKETPGGSEEEDEDDDDSVSSPDNESDENEGFADGLAVGMIVVGSKHKRMTPKEVRMARRKREYDHKMRTRKYNEEYSDDDDLSLCCCFTEGARKDDAVRAEEGTAGHGPTGETVKHDDSKLSFSLPKFPGWIPFLISLYVTSLTVVAIGCVCLFAGSALAFFIYNSEYIAKQLVIAAALVGAAGVAMALGVIVKEHRAYLMKQAENCANNLSGACEKCGYGKEEDMAKVP